MDVKKTERGWAGHFCCADRCQFRRNTLLEYDNISIVVSSVGLMRGLNGGGFEEIGLDRYYETMVFHSNPKDERYKDADVQMQIYDIENCWAISDPDSEDLANTMHDNVVIEIEKRLLSGERFEVERL